MLKKELLRRSWWVKCQHHIRLYVPFYLVFAMTNIVAAPLSPPAPNALPTGATITAGQAAVATSGNTLQVNQSTPNLAVNWGSFNIGQQAAVIFNQPSASATALNRVMGVDPSQIYGTLKANGQVFLLNPNGVLFGKGAQIDVGGMVASSLALTDKNYLAGKYNFTSDGSAGMVNNQGTIIAKDGGYVLLLAPQVSNSGTISAPQGKVGLVAGQNISVGLEPEGLLSVNVDAGALHALAENSGVLQAEGGQVQLSARALSAMATQVINQSGQIQANSIHTRDGKIILDGGDTGEVVVSGQLDASGKTADAKGGQINILGDKIAVLEQTRIDASGPSGGGSVLIGGNWHGQGPQQNATAVWIGPTSQINADALNHGDGGEVVLWSQDYTNFLGNISAQGGLQGGHGGAVETSSHGQLNVLGKVSTAAFNGHAGTWLLDPADVTISSAVTSSESAGPTFVPSANPAVVNVNDINSALNAGTNVTIQTSGASGGSGDITVANSIAKTAGGNALLTLNADRNITLNSGAGITSTTGQLGVNMNAALTSAGSIVLNGNNIINTNGGAMNFVAGTNTIQGSVSVLNGSQLNSSGGNIMVANGTSGSPSSAVAQDAILFGTGAKVTINAGSGNININGYQSTRVGAELYNAQLTTTGNGQISVIGNGATFGIAIKDSQISAGGKVLLLGTATSASSDANEAGISIWTGNNVLTSAAAGPQAVVLQGIDKNINRFAINSGNGTSGGGTLAITTTNAGDIIIQGQDGGNNTGMNLSRITVNTNGGA